VEEWIKEIVEQVCIAKVVQASKLESDKRLALIILDNAVESGLKFYASYHGKVDQKNLVTSEGYFNALNAITPSLITAEDAKDLKQFHNHRNSLYHGAKLTTVKDDLIDRYEKLARKLFDVLFQYSMTEPQWKVQINKARIALVKDGGILEPVTYREKEIEGIKLVEMKISSSIKNTEAIQLVIHGYNTTYAREPNCIEFEKSLKVSTIAIPSDTIDVYLSQLRKAGKIERGRLALKPAATDILRKKFIFN
jgi:hypothetical protein